MRARVDCSSWDWSRDIATQRVQQTSHWGGGDKKGVSSLYHNTYCPRRPRPGRTKTEVAEAVPTTGQN